MKLASSTRPRAMPFARFQRTSEGRFAKKTQKTPDREIELGKKRLKEML